MFQVLKAFKRDEKEGFEIFKNLEDELCEVGSEPMKRLKN